MEKQTTKPKPQLSLAKRLLLLLSTFVILDLFLRVLVFCGLLPYQQYPTLGGNPTFLDDINPVFGVWHYPNASMRRKTLDYDVTYHSNSHGARDRERTLESTASRRIVVLGDSYVEGLGVEHEKRFTDRLEAQTGIEHLNFGTSGCFGSIQQWLLYESLASTFDHSEVFIFTLPFNDFSDNEPNDFPATRYRPYLQKTDIGFEVTYPVSFKDRQVVFRDWPKIIKNTIDNNWYLANLLRWTTRRIKEQQSQQDRPITVSTTPPYDRFTALDLERLLYSYEQIIAKADNRPVTIFTIPAREDFTWAQEKGYQFKLVNELEVFAARHEHVHYVDLLPLQLDYAQKHQVGYSHFTHAHDDHWSSLGHELIAGMVYSVVHQKQPSSSPEP